MTMSTLVFESMVPYHYTVATHPQPHLSPYPSQVGTGDGAKTLSTTGLALQIIEQEGLLGLYQGLAPYLVCTQTTWSSIAISCILPLYPSGRLYTSYPSAFLPL